MRKILVIISILFVCIFISFAKEINRTFYGLTFHTSYKIVMAFRKRKTQCIGRRSKYCYV